MLSTHFEKVVIIESETLSTPDSDRKNVPQYFQVHTIVGVHERPKRPLRPNRSYNSLTTRSNRFSLTSTRPCSEPTAGHLARWTITTPKGTVSSSRPISWSALGFACLGLGTRLRQDSNVTDQNSFEPMIRKMVMEIKNVEFVNGTVTGLTVAQDKSRVTGITYRRKTEEGQSSKEQTMDAVFVADCTGPSCAGIKWLKAHDYAIPSKVQYSPAIHYSTVTFPTTAELRENTIWPDNTKWDDAQVLLYANAADAHNGREYGVYLQRTEQKRLMLALMGWGPNVIPDSKATIEDVIDFAARDPKLKNFAEDGRKFIEEARKQGENPQPHRLIVQNCWQYDYASVAGLPSNFVCMGDSRERVNPTVR
jgi:hypothetical protein